MIIAQRSCAVMCAQYQKGSIILWWCSMNVRKWKSDFCKVLTFIEGKVDFEKCFSVQTKNVWLPIVTCHMCGSIIIYVPLTSYDVYEYCCDSISYAFPSIHHPRLCGGVLGGGRGSTTRTPFFPRPRSVFVQRQQRIGARNLLFSCPLKRPGHTSS